MSITVEDIRREVKEKKEFKDKAIAYMNKQDNKSLVELFKK